MYDDYNYKHTNLMTFIIQSTGVTRTKTNTKIGGKIRWNFRLNCLLEKFYKNINCLRGWRNAELGADEFAKLNGDWRVSRIYFYHLISFRL